MIIAILVRSLTGGGAERVAALWAEGFFCHGNKVFLLLDDNSDDVTFVLPEGIIVKKITDHHNNKITRNILRIHKLRKALKEIAPDVVIDVSPRLSKRISLLFTPGVKIATEHHSFEKPANAPIKSNIVRRALLDSSYSYTTVLTEADLKILRKFFKRNDVMPNPLAFNPIDLNGLQIKEPIVLAAGRLDAWYVKGFDLLLQAWQIVHSNYPNWKLHIAGGGSKGALLHLSGICKECGVEDSVVFLGFDRHLIERYKEASIFVLSSRYEGFGMVLIEAMSQGCACVAADYKGRQREIIEDESQGLICNTENVGDLAHSITMLMSNDSLRNKIQRNSIERSKDFCLDNIINKWYSIFDKMHITYN